jgi:hypothetical protein
MSIAAQGVQDRQPCLSRGVEPPWSNAGKASGLRGITVLTIDIEKLVDRGAAFCMGRRLWRERLRATTQSSSERVADTGNPLRAESRDPCEAPIMRGGLEAFERVDT